MDHREEPVNPFASPLSDDQAFRPVAPVDEASKPCPDCGAADSTPAPYDWWRGRRGPKAIDHVICSACLCQFNGATGAPYPRAKSPLPWFIVALVLFILYVAMHILLIVDG